MEIEAVAIEVKLFDWQRCAGLLALLLLLLTGWRTRKRDRHSDVGERDATEANVGNAKS